MSTETAKVIQNMKKDDIRVVIMVPRARLKAAGRERWKGVAKKKRSEILSAAGKASWANMTPKERSAEQKRRIKVRKQKREKSR
jgi:hypothetical protein